MDVGQSLRTVRCSRRLSQRELAELAAVPRSTIDRIEAGATSPRVRTLARVLAAAGYDLAICDHRGRQLVIREDNEDLVDRGDRRFPAHLRAGPTPGYFDAGYWWGWHNIAWPYSDDWVPADTYGRRSKLAQFTGRDVRPGERGRVWDDAT